MADHIIETQGAVVGALKASGIMTALVPPTRIYGPEPPATPAWPWTMCGMPDGVPSREACHDTSIMSFVVHGFAKGPGNVAAANIGNAIKRTLDGAVILRNGVSVDISVQQVQVIRDSAEASAYHAIVRCEAYCSEEV